MDAVAQGRYAHRVEVEATEELGELVRQVLREPLTSLFGRSGLGKTSLLKAGLFPRLREEDYLPIYVRLDHAGEAPALCQQVYGELQAACETNRIQASHPAQDESLWSFFHRRDTEFWTVPPVIVFDQFEEILTVDPANRAAKTAFFTQVGAALHAAAALWTLLTVAASFLSSLAAFSVLAASAPFSKIESKASRIIRMTSLA